MVCRAATAGAFRTVGFCLCKNIDSRWVKKATLITSSGSSKLVSDRKEGRNPSHTYLIFVYCPVTSCASNNYVLPSNKIQKKTSFMTLGWLSLSYYIFSIFYYLNMFQFYEKFSYSSCKIFFSLDL